MSASLTAPCWNAAQIAVYRSLEGLGLGAKSLVILDKSPPHAEPASSSVRWGRSSHASPQGLLGEPGRGVPATWTLGLPVLQG